MKGSLMSWPKTKKIIVLKCYLILCNNELFLNWMVSCNKKWISYYNQWCPAQWLDQAEALKHVLKATLAPEKVLVTLVVCCQSGPLQLSKFLSKTITSEKYAHIHHRSVLTMRWHWTPCRQRWSSPSLLHGNAWPHSHNQCLESWMKWATEFCLILHIHLTSSQSTTTFSSISPAFCRENTSKTSRMHRDKLNSSWQKCVDCSGSYFK